MQSLVWPQWIAEWPRCHTLSRFPSARGTVIRRNKVGWPTTIWAFATTAFPAAVTLRAAVKIEENKKESNILATEFETWSTKTNAKCPAPVRYGTASTRSRPNCCRVSPSSSSRPRSSLRCHCFLPEEDRHPSAVVPGALHRRRRPSTLTGPSAVAAAVSVPAVDGPIWTSGYHRAEPGGPSRRCAFSRSWRRAAC